MAWTQTDIDTLKNAMKTGAYKVKYADGREATYRTLEEMRSLLAEMKDEVYGRQRQGVSFTQHSSGF
ncbi:MAG: hypothetical protein ROR55_20995 [Devosia sp.]